MRLRYSHQRHGSGFVFVKPQPNAPPKSSQLENPRYIERSGIDNGGEISVWEIYFQLAANKVRTAGGPELGATVQCPKISVKFGDLARLRATYLPSPFLGYRVVWVRVGLGSGLASGKGWVGAWPVTRLDPNLV